MSHVPVLLKEIIKYLDPEPNENFIDATLGGGGHAFAILEKISPNGKLLGIDLSKDAISKIKEARNDQPSIKDRLILVNDNFANLSEIIKKYNFLSVSGIIVDLGLSSDLLEASRRGFSFQKDEFLDMRFGETGKTAYEIINQGLPEELEEIFRKYGEEKFSGLIALNIVKVRQKRIIKATKDLVKVIADVIKDKVPERFQIKTFARIFQALRIAVNNELENLKKVLYQSIEILSPGGKIAVISFHSLEDRIVKNFFRDKKNDGLLKILTKKPVTPDFKEIKINPRARSAKLRVAQKI